MKKRHLIVWFSLLAVLILAVVIGRDKIHFDWAMFWQQLRHADLWHVGAATALIYGTYWIRSVRWAVFLTPTKKVPAYTLLGSQFIGFTAVALFGRLADLTRPYLVAKRVEMSLSSQIAVYTIERMFDLGAAAIVFSSALAFSSKEMPHHELFVRTGRLSLAATCAIAIFAVTVRLAGGAVARLARLSLGGLSKPVAESIATKIEGFREGLNALSSFRDFGVAVLLSLAMWGMIGGAYLQTVHAFVDTPELAGLTYSRTMLLMAASLGGSLLQLPIIGWFTQIAVTAGAMHTLYGAPIEVATACGGVLLMVTFISIIPTGLIYARLEHVSLKTVAKESGAASTDDAEEAVVELH